LELFGFGIVAGEEDGREPAGLAAVAAPRGKAERKGGREGEIRKNRYASWKEGGREGGREGTYQAPIGTRSRVSCRPSM